MCQDEGVPLLDQGLKKVFGVWAGLKYVDGGVEMLQDSEGRAKVCGNTLRVSLHVFFGSENAGIVGVHELEFGLYLELDGETFDDRSRQVEE